MNEEIENKFDSFLKIKSARDLAELLGLKLSFITYVIFKLRDDVKYSRFEIKKRNGETREIIAPISKLKLIQTKLNEILQIGFKHKTCIHGYVYQRNILTNAQKHLKKKYLVNIDLQDFFPSIHFGRIRGLFMSHPFTFDKELASIVANVCCHQGKLPQGSPVSPIISNYICRKLDNDILKLIKGHKITYSRYADDITFSSNLNKLPSIIGEIKENKLILSSELNSLVEGNGFKINPAKTKFATRSNRQQVTGIITNEKLNVKRKYIRNIRAMLHAWEKFGIEKAASEHFSKYNYKFKTSSDIISGFKNEITGKIGFVGFVKGKDNEVYKKLVSRIKTLSPEVNLAIVLKDNENETIPLIYGEGKSDWKHLKAALSALQLKGKFTNLNVKFREYDEHLNMNNDDLLGICKSLPKTPLKNMVICIFDRDSKRFVDKAMEGEDLFKHWGNNVYSLVLPKPAHRDFSEISIEHYYLDSEIKTMDVNQRRLYLANEFDKDTGKHISGVLIYSHIRRLSRVYPFIIDDDVLNEKDENVALSKDNFAKNILSKEQLFSKFNFDHFEILFDQIKGITDLPNAKYVLAEK